MDSQAISPEIASLSWGKVVLDDGTVYKDVKLWPGGSREWDWNETGTRHVPGIQPADLQELIEHGAEVIVLSKGINERLRTRDQTVKLLKDKGIDFHILQSGEAVNKYNKLRGDRKVAALIHSTC